jgi:hypothetical protein
MSALFCDRTSGGIGKLRKTGIRGGDHRHDQAVAEYTLKAVLGIILTCGNRLHDSPLHLEASMTASTRPVDYVPRGRIASPASGRSVRLIVLLAVFAFLLWAYDTMTVAMHDGRFYLTVYVGPASHAAIESVTCAAFVGEGEATDALRRGLPIETRDWPASADPFTGKPLRLWLPYRTQATGLRPIDDFQHQALAVLASYRDGRQVGRVVAIPHRDVSRSVSVMLP